MLHILGTYPQLPRNPSKSLYYTIKEVSLSVKITQIEIDKLRATGDVVDELNAQIKELGIEQTQVVAVGAFRELNILLDIMKSYPIYTRDEIEKGQAEYWEKRLNRQEIASPNQQAIDQARAGLKELE